jgi:hypothetical protein
MIDYFIYGRRTPMMTPITSRRSANACVNKLDNRELHR